MADGKSPSFAVQQARRELREAERTLKDLEKRNIQGPQLDDAKKAVKEAEKQLKKLTTGSREDRREERQDFMDDYYNELGGPWVAELVKSDPTLNRLIQKAIKEGWDPGRFQDELYQTDWWTDPEKSASWKAAFQSEFAKDKTQWNQSLDDAKLAIKEMAKGMYNMVIPDAVLDRIARKYMYEGWDRNGGRGLQVWLSERFGRQEDRGAELTPGGQLLDTERTLAAAARAYGVTRDDAWFTKTSRDIMNPDSNYTEDDAWNELIAEAEDLYPVFAGKLSKDRSVRDLGAGYLGQMARYLELDGPDGIDLTDPLLQRAFTSLDDAGNPTLMPLWKFNQEIKKDDRWQYTTNALSTYSQIGSDLARMMGFVG